MNRELLRDLRATLANLYSDTTSIRRILADTDINASRIEFSGNALNTWHSILAEAEKTAQVGDLLTAVGYEYGSNETFRQILERFQQENTQTSPVASTPPHTSTSTPTDTSTQIDTWKRQLANYRQSLILIEERMSEYIDPTDIPLQLIKNKQQTEAHIAELTEKLKDHAA